MMNWTLKYIDEDGQIGSTRMTADTLTEAIARWQKPHPDHFIVSGEQVREVSFDRNTFDPKLRSYYRS